MTNQVSEPESISQGGSETSEDAAYNLMASSYCRGGIVIWCIAGWIYAAVTWRLLWLPGILVFVPGIFCAGVTAAVFFVPLWLVMKKVNRDWELDQRKHVGLLMFATLLKLGGFIASIAGPIGYVNMLRHFVD
jgi:hypothetical protein